MRSNVSWLWSGALWACLLSASVPAGTAASITGRGTLSGTITASRPFQAAQVYAHHLEKNVVFMVYTAGGNFRAVNLFPGAYDVWAEKKGFSSAAQKVQIEAGKNATVNIALSSGQARPAPRGGRSGGEALAQLPYDELFPRESGRELAEKSCIFCHGADFISRAPRSRDAWESAINLMTRGEADLRYQGVLFPRSNFTEPQWTTLLDYLTKHFGPNAPRRSVTPPDVDVPVDEQALSKAMWIEYRLANVGAFKQRRVQETHLDNKGNVWFTERGKPSSVGRITPRTAELRDYMHPTPATGDPHGLVVDLDGNTWWAGRLDYLGRINPNTGEIKTYPAEHTSWYGHTPVLDSKGNIWFSNVPGNKLGRWDRATDKIRIFENPTEGGRTYGIFVDRNDRVWWANYLKCGVGMYDPATEKWSAYTAPSGQNCQVRRLGMDAKGIVWFGQYSSGKLGRIDPVTGKVTEVTLPVQPARTYDVWPDTKGNVWITDDGTQASMIKYEPDTNKFTYYPSPQQADMPKVTLSHDGGIWYAPRSSPNAAVGVFYADMSTMEENPYQPVRQPSTAIQPPRR